MKTIKLLLAILLTMLSLCISASVVQAVPNTTATPTISAKPSSPLNFVIGVPGKTGCLVCHGDPKITSAKTKSNIYVNPEIIGSSIHKDVACISCHTDFTLFNATQSHAALKTDFKKVAGLSCKNCHEHSKQLQVYSQSIHGRLAMSSDPKGGATCADCHGSHDIKSFKKDKAYEEAYHLAGGVICGKCHQDYANKYNDYYHGKAYNMKASDAPACWDCHGSHSIKPAEDGTSHISNKQLPKTCGKCHHDSKKNFAEFGRMIHGSKAMYIENLALGFVYKIWIWVDANVLGKASEYFEQAKVTLFYRQQR